MISSGIFSGSATLWGEVEIENLTMSPTLHEKEGLVRTTLLTRIAPFRMLNLMRSRLIVGNWLLNSASIRHFFCAARYIIHTVGKSPILQPDYSV